MSNYLIPKQELIAEYYDPSREESVLRYAKLIKGDTLRPHLTNQAIEEAKADHEESNANKGEFGNLLEAGYFKLKNNNESRPDIPETGIEIKTGQVWKKTARGARMPSDVIKERLKISMIDYMESFNYPNLQGSHLWTKVENILLLLFHRDSAVLKIDQQCVYSDLLSWDQDEINQMSEDWLHIKNMVVTGKANEISEGHTWYLGACTAGTGSLRDAPMGVRVKQRAFSLKNSYLNYKLGYRKKPQAPKVIITPTLGQSLDSYILDNMKSFFDKPLNEVAIMIRRPELADTNAKNKASKIARMLLEEVAGNPTEKVITNFEQFKKAGVIEKTITLEKTGTLKESLSFPAFKWKELEQEEEWEDSELYSALTSKFFFTVFKKTSISLPIFIGCFFWTMPKDDIEEMKVLWLDTRNKVRAREYKKFMKISDGLIGHVRPHGTKDETFPTSHGTNEGKKSFWLHSLYIKSIVKKEFDI